MMAKPLTASLLAIACLSQNPAPATPPAEVTATEIRVTARDYRATFARASADFSIELKGSRGQWFPIAKSLDRAEFGISGGGALALSSSARADTRHEVKGGCAVVGRTILLGADIPAALEVHFLCADEGVLIRTQCLQPGGGDPRICWALPRIPLDLNLWDQYAFWDPKGKCRAGKIATLGEQDRYAGVSPWGRTGDTADRFSPEHPALFIGASREGIGLAAVFLRYETDWATCHGFIQRHTPHSLFFYPGIAPTPAADPGLWAWLAPLPMEERARSQQIAALLTLGERHMAEFARIAPPADPRWLRPIPDFPAELRRDAPVTDIQDAIVYTINEHIDSDRGIRAARKAGSDVLVRGWFKWRDAQDWEAQAHLVPRAHALGALFGGGVTCSALYHGENGLPEERVLDMATRGPDGNLADAWGEPGTRHGTLSNPAYLEYVLSFCKRQIDAGADYLFMDEINAALHPNEGFDDYSIADFRTHLMETYGRGKGWGPRDPRWRETFGQEISDPRICPDGTIATLDYRAFLMARGIVENPRAPANPFSQDWTAFRRERDDRAWKHMTAMIRKHASENGRTVLISGNGLARYVDLQVLGVWGLWKAKDGRIDLSESLVDQWSGTVTAGRALAGARVPIVFFHDWGFGGFPWIRDVPPQERELWIRVRASEIYASGAFFAFPVNGPWGNDAMTDGTIHEIARQARFYRSHRNLFLGPKFVGSDGLETPAADLSLALWKRQDPPALILHVINRQAKDSRPVPRTAVDVTLPTPLLPQQISVVSPDWDGAHQAIARAEGGRLRVTIPSLDAYAVATLDYTRLPDVSLGGPRIRPALDWSWPGAPTMVIGPDGLPRNGIPAAFLHGDLHSHLGTPQHFQVHLPRGGRLRICIGAVATLGARIECQIDDLPPIPHDLPDLDRKNDPDAREYDRILVFDIPTGPHRITIRNTGGDWAHASWYAFDGEIAP